MARSRRRLRCHVEPVEMLSKPPVILQWAGAVTANICIFSDPYPILPPLTGEGADLC
jgi:hypothetical protein